MDGRGEGESTPGGQVHPGQAHQTSGNAAHCLLQVGNTTIREMFSLV